MQPGQKLPTIWWWYDNRGRGLTFILKVQFKNFIYINNIWTLPSPGRCCGVRAGQAILTVCVHWCWIIYTNLHETYAYITKYNIGIDNYNVIPKASAWCSHVPVWPVVYRYISDVELHYKYIINVHAE